MKFLIKRKAINHIEIMTKKVEDMYDYAMPLYNSWSTGARLKILKKYDDIYDAFFGLSSFNPKLMNLVLEDIRQIIWLFDDYRSYVRTESSKIFLECVTLFLRLRAFKQGYEGKKFNPKSKRFSDVKEHMELLLYEAHRYNFHYLKSIQEDIKELEKFEKKVERFRDKFEKEEEEYRNSDEYIEDKKWEQEFEKSIEKSHKRREKAAEKAAEKEQIELRKKLGLKINEEINPKLFTSEQKRIWDQINREKQEQADKLVEASGTKIRRDI